VTGFRDVQKSGYTTPILEEEDMQLKKRNPVVAALAIAFLALTLGACAAKQEDRSSAISSARAALAEILNAIPNFTTFGTDNNYVLFSAPSNIDLEFACDFAFNESDPSYKSQVKDFSLSFFSDEYVEAGLDLDKLCNPQNEDFRIGGESFPKIVVSWELGSNSLKKSNPEAGPIEALLTVFDEILRSQPERFLTDTDRGLYGIDLGRGDSILWAKQPSKTKTDFIVSLDPAPFIAAGAKVEKLINFSLVRSKIKNSEGKVVEVQKLEQSGDRL